MRELADKNVKTVIINNTQFKKVEKKHAHDKERKRLYKKDPDFQMTSRN